jgi:Dolichyl-phosphate-mannose-protein mannosyltransferase
VLRSGRQINLNFATGAAFTEGRPSFPTRASKLLARFPVELSTVSSAANAALPLSRQRIVSTRLPLAKVIALVVILGIGVFLRLPPALFDTNAASLHTLAELHLKAAAKAGFDERLYEIYTDGLIAGGLGSYPDMVSQYREHQATLVGSILPPLRFLYIFAAYVWHALFGTEALPALHAIAALFSILTLLLTTLFIARVKDLNWALGVAALMAFAPTQLHMSQHALVDGFFTFWATLALWALWESLHAPRDWRWLLLLIFSLTALVLTKENAAFVWIGVVAILVANRWLNFGAITSELLGAVIFGPTLGAVILVWLSGGVPELIATYQLSITKNYHLSFAILTGDGPWYRYLVDLLLVSPIVLLLAIGFVFTLRTENKFEWFLLIFIAASYATMCNIKYGMNLRYANMWDFPLRVLALAQIAALVRHLPRCRNAILVTAVAMVGASELHNYIRLAVKYPLYELVTIDLMRALDMGKTPSSP